MRFLMFNLVVAGALFYLLTGGDIQQARILMESDTAQAAKGRAEQMVDIAKEAVGELASPFTEPKKQIAPSKIEPVTVPEAAPKPVEPSKMAELPPLDGEKVVRPRVTHEAPNGISPGLPAPQEEQEVTQLKEGEDLDEKRLARKRELSRMVYDMERLFAEKLAR